MFKLHFAETQDRIIYKIAKKKRNAVNSTFLPLFINAADRNRIIL